MDTISISIGDARSSTCIVLPRGHELVRHLESLLPATTVRAASPEPPASSQYMFHQDTRQFQNPSVPPPQMEMAPPRPFRPTPPGMSPIQQPHRSAALIQKLLHRPGSDNDSDSSAPAVRNPYRRGRLANASLGSSKRCQVPDCGKISVSRGVCRAHGGGRRCQYHGCPKSAQSRGDFCWSHGGGHRCEVPDCMRSRKSKRFCKLHLNWAGSAATTRTRAPVPRPLAPLPRADSPVPLPPPASTMPLYSHGHTRLPSLHQALQSQQDAAPRTISPPMPYPGGFTSILTNSISC